MTVTTSIEDGIGTILIDRPERMNALSQDMKDALLDALDRFAQDEGVRAVILRGTEKAFCAGADVTSMAKRGISPGRLRIKNAQSIIKAMEHLEKPIVSAVSGPAVGIGWSLALASDFILASPSARFGQVFKKIGLAPDGGSVFLLSQYVGVLRAKELAMTGRIIGAEEAFRLGLVTELVPEAELFPRASALARELAGSAPLALAMTKRMFVAVAGTDLDRFLEIESHIQNQLLQTSDHAEGVDAFLNKRSPVFHGQ